MSNTQLLKGIRCPKCLETQRFAVQVTINTFIVDDGLETMSSQPELDHFPGRTIDENDGLHDEDPISCANRNGCNYMGTVAEFRELERTTDAELGGGLAEDDAFNPYGAIARGLR